MHQKKDISSNLTNFVIIALILISAYLLYSITLAFYRSHQIDIYIQKFEEENERIENENAMLLEEFDYVTSPAYIDKILKQNKGLINPGEDVIIISSTNTEDINPQDELIQNLTEKDIDSLSNIEKWQLFIFQGNQFH